MADHHHQDLPIRSSRPLTSFRILSFDIYGTLVDWSSGIVDALSPLLSRLPSIPSESSLLTEFNTLEARLQSQNPGMIYSGLLTRVFTLLAQKLLGPEQAHAEAAQLEVEARAFGEGIAKWPAYVDTVAAMQTLKKRYKLIALSNVDRESFAGTLKGPLKGVDFDAIYTAEEIGSYKPDHKNFHYLLDHAKAKFGVEKWEVLHVAQSLSHDHVPAKEMGLTSVWIARGGAGNKAMGGHGDVFGKVAYSWVFESLGEFAEDVERAFEGE